METALDGGACFMVEDLLNFTLDADEEDNENEYDKIRKAPSSSSEPSDPISNDPDDQSLSLPEVAEEELEWLSNKDVFPAVETWFAPLADNPGIRMNHQSPVSVLENSSTATSSCKSNSSSSSIITGCYGGRIPIPIPVQYPVKARSKRRRRRRCGFPELLGRQCWWVNLLSIKSSEQEPPAVPHSGGTSSAIGRRCQHCGAEKTPQWRAGPMGPKSLCNACGVRYKSGRLVPEYRPASSPTFSTLVHSNSHRKIVEMRRQKQLAGMVVNEACAYRVG